MPRTKLKAFDPFNNNLKQKSNYAKLQSGENKTVFDLPPDRQVGRTRKRKRSNNGDGSNEPLSRSERQFQSMLAAAKSTKKPKTSNNQSNQRPQSKKKDKKVLTPAEKAQAESEAQLKPVYTKHILHPSNRHIKAPPEINYNSKNEIIAPNPDLDRIPEPARFAKRREAESTDRHQARSEDEEDDNVDIDDEQYEDEDLPNAKPVRHRATEFAGVDHVQFGEVVDRPPTLTHVKGAPTERVRVPESVRQMLGQAAAPQAKQAAPTSAIERARREAIAAYNQLREKRRTESQAKFSDLQQRRASKAQK